LIDDGTHAKIPMTVVMIPSSKKITMGERRTHEAVSCHCGVAGLDRRDPHSHDLTEPIDSILRIPEANNPPNAPASGEQTAKQNLKFISYASSKYFFVAAPGSPRYMASRKASSRFGYHLDR
jgi:hypothetical protein